MTEPQYRRNVLILIPESAHKVCEIVIYLGNPGSMEKAVIVLGAVGDEVDGSSGPLRPIFGAFLHIRTCLSSGSLHRDQSDVQAGVGGGRLLRWDVPICDVV